MRKAFLAAAVAAFSVAGRPAAAQTVDWRVVAAESGSIPAPDLPANASRGFTDLLLGDIGAGLVGFRVTSPDAYDGYWARNAQGTLVRYMQPGVTGALGPGRTGEEAGHVFRDYDSGWGSAGADGRRYFVARAGGPDAPATELSYGLWRWDLTRNVELARTLDDGPLGPNLGPGAVFPNSSGFVSGFLPSAGAAVFRASYTSATGANQTAYFRNVPGQPNQACAIVGSTDPAYSPNLGSGSFSSSPWSLSTTPDGRFYGRFATSNSREGVWRICEGAPQPVVLDEETGARGPDLGIPTAYFTSFYGNAVPGDGDTFFFVATGRESQGGAAFGGLFLHEGAGNRPLALNGDTGEHSPHWLEATFNGVDEGSLSAAGRYASFEANLRTPDGGDPRGLFRVTADGVPETVALIGLPGDYGPEPNRTWRSFSDSAVLANGDIVLEATTDPGSERALWLLQAGQAPRRLLTSGQSVTVPTASGTGQTAISDWSLPNESGGGAQYARGADSWIGADGTILVSARLEDYSGKTLLMARPSNPIDRIFTDGFDG